VVAQQLVDDCVVPPVVRDAAARVTALRNGSPIPAWLRARELETSLDEDYSSSYADLCTVGEWRTELQPFSYRREGVSNPPSWSTHLRLGSS
jgi:hypothetical protein